MKISLIVEGKNKPVTISVRAESADGIVGDSFVRVLPTEKFLDLTHAQLVKMGSGVHEVD